MKVRFEPIGKECEIKPGQSVLEVAQKNGIYIKSVCRGAPNCAECRINVTAGADYTIPPGSAEVSLIGTVYHLDGRRLSCQLKCLGDITIDLGDQISKRDSGASKRPRGLSKTDREDKSHAKQGIVALEDSGDSKPSSEEE